MHWALERRHYQPAAKHTICLSSASCAHKHTHTRPHWHTYWQEIRGRSPGLNGENWEAEWMNTALTFSVSVIQASNSRHLRLYMRAVKHIPQVTQVPHRQRRAHQQTARDMKSWLRVKSSPAEMCETAAQHSWGPLCHYQIIVSVDSGHDAPEVYMKEGLLWGSKPLISNPKKW